MQYERLEVEAFLYLEARLADENAYEEWLALWDEEALYWVPCVTGGADPELDVSLIHDNRHRIEERIRRLGSGKVPSQVPPSQLCRVIGNIEIEPDGLDVVIAHSTFHLTELRNHRMRTWVGRTQHRLRLASDVAPRYRMVMKKVMLLNAEEALPAMTFLI